MLKLDVTRLKEEERSRVACGQVRDTIRAVFFIVFAHNQLLDFRQACLAPPDQILTPFIRLANKHPDTEYPQEVPLLFVA